MPTPAAFPATRRQLIASATVGAGVAITVALLGGMLAYVVLMAVCLPGVAVRAWGYRPMRPWNRVYRLSWLKAVDQVEKVAPVLGEREQAALVESLVSVWGGSRTARMRALTAG